MRTKHHMSVNLQGLLDHHKGKKIRIMEDDNGRIMSDREARNEIGKLLALGHKLMPCGQCEGFDPFGGGCPGHPIKEIDVDINYDLHEGRGEDNELL